jgi:hypothetical protein
MTKRPACGAVLQLNAITPGCDQFLMVTAPDIDEAIENAYRVFARYRLGGRIIVCGCNSCVSPQVEQELIRTPLNALPAPTLAEYTHSAHGWDGRVEDDLRYFLPRYLELIAIGEIPSTTGVDTCLRRLADADYRNTWPAAEAKALNDAFAALLRVALEVPPSCEMGRIPTWDVDTAEELICMVAFANGDVDLMLAAWDAERTRNADLHLANMIGNADWLDRRLRSSTWYRLGDARVKAEAERVVTWLVRSETRARLEQACLAERDPEMADLLSFAEGIIGGLLDNAARSHGSIRSVS